MFFISASNPAQDYESIMIMINNKLKNIHNDTGSFLMTDTLSNHPHEVNSCGHPAELLSEYGKALRIMGGFTKCNY